MTREFADSSNAFENRSWNEEFINYNASKIDDTQILEKVNRAKLGRRSQQEFLKNCKILVESIARGEIQSISPGAEGQERCYIKNSSFVSVAKDNPDHWRAPQGEEDVANYSVVNSDLRNLSEVLKLGQRDTQFINTVLLDRLGTRFVVQNMVEGMLYFDPRSWGKYGTFDDGKSFSKGADFDGLMKSLCQKMWLTQDNRYKSSVKSTDEDSNIQTERQQIEQLLLDSSKVVNQSGVEKAENGDEIILHGSSEVKGIVAGDGRRYLMDLMRLSPRDANFADPIEHSTCLLRPELIKNYQVMRTLERYYKTRAEKIQKEAAKKEMKESEKLKQIENESETKETKTEEIEKTNSKEEDIRFELNPSLLTNIPSFGPDTERELKNLNKMAIYLLNEAIPAVVVELTDTQNRRSSMDCEALVKVMHRNGVNTRYLGKLLALLKPKKQKFLESLVKFTIYTRAFVKTCREFVVRFKEQNPVEVLLHMLNLALQPSPITNSEDLERNSTQPITDPDAELQNQISKKNKKKRKRKKKKVSSPEKTLTGLKAFSWFHFRDPQTQRQYKQSFKSISKIELLSRMSEIALKKYSFSEEISPDFLNSQNDRVRFLREISLKLGLKFKAHAIDFSDRGCPQLKPRDIAGINCRIKAFRPALEEIRYNMMSADREFKKGDFAKALEILRVYMPVAISVHGIFHSDPIMMLSKMSECLSRLKQSDRALQHQTLAYLLSLRVYGAHHATTVHSLGSLGIFFGFGCLVFGILVLVLVLWRGSALLLGI